MDENGISAEIAYCRNSWIEEFNSTLVETHENEMIDLYDYLVTTGYEALYTEQDKTGMHYTKDTCDKIHKFLVEQTKLGEDK